MTVFKLNSLLLTILFTWLFRKHIGRNVLLRNNISVPFFFSNLKFNYNTYCNFSKQGVNLAFYFMNKFCAMYRCSGPAGRTCFILIQFVCRKFICFCKQMEHFFSAADSSVQLNLCVDLAGSFLCYCTVLWHSICFIPFLRSKVMTIFSDKSSSCDLLKVLK